MRCVIAPLLCAGLLLGPLAGQAADEPLRSAVSTAWGAPFAQLRDGQSPEGLNIELIQLIAQQLRRKPVYVTLPRARLDAAAESGEIDLRCHVNAEWVRQPGSYEWSLPLWVLPEVLIGAVDTPALKRLGDLRLDHTVGTVLHYRYPVLDAQFSPGTWRRDDAPAVDRMLGKLALGRTQYAITTLFELNAFVFENPTRPLSEWRLSLGHVPYQCAAPKAGRLKGADLQAALQALREQGLLDALLRRHGLPTVAVVAAAGSELPALDREQLESLYLGRLRALEDGRVPQLMALSDSSLTAFSELVLKRSASQLRAEWSRATFSGSGRKPRLLDNAATLKAALRQKPLGIGVLPLHEVDAGLRILYLP